MNKNSLVFYSPETINDFKDYRLQAHDIARYISSGRIPSLSDMLVPIYDTNTMNIRAKAKMSNKMILSYEKLKEYQSSLREKVMCNYIYDTYTNTNTLIVGDRVYSYFTLPKLFDFLSILPGLAMMNPTTYMRLHMKSQPSINDVKQNSLMGDYRYMPMKYYHNTDTGVTINQTYKEMLFTTELYNTRVAIQQHKKSLAGCQCKTPYYVKYTKTCYTPQMQALIDNELVGVIDPKYYCYTCDCYRYTKVPRVYTRPDTKIVKIPNNRRVNILKSVNELPKSMTGLTRPEYLQTYSYLTTNGPNCKLDIKFLTSIKSSTTYITNSHRVGYTGTDMVHYLENLLKRQYEVEIALTYTNMCNSRNVQLSKKQSRSSKKRNQKQPELTKPDTTLLYSKQLPYYNTLSDAFNMAMREQKFVPKQVIEKYLDVNNVLLPFDAIELTRLYEYREPIYYQNYDASSHLKLTEQYSWKVPLRYVLSTNQEEMFNPVTEDTKDSTDANDTTDTTDVKDDEEGIVTYDMITPISRKRQLLAAIIMCIFPEVTPDTYSYHPWYKEFTERYNYEETHEVLSDVTHIINRLYPDLYQGAVSTKYRYVLPKDNVMSYVTEEDLKYYHIRDRDIPNIMGSRPVDPMLIDKVTKANYTFAPIDKLESISYVDNQEMINISPYREPFVNHPRYTEHQHKRCVDRIMLIETVMHLIKNRGGYCNNFKPSKQKISETLEIYHPRNTRTRALRYNNIRDAIVNHYKKDITNHISEQQISELTNQYLRYEYVCNPEDSDISDNELEPIRNIKPNTDSRCSEESYMKHKELVNIINSVCTKEDPSVANQDYQQARYLYGKHTEYDELLYEQILEFVQSKGYHILFYNPVTYMMICTESREELSARCKKLKIAEIVYHQDRVGIMTHSAEYEQKDPNRKAMEYTHRITPLTNDILHNAFSTTTANMNLVVEYLSYMFHDTFMNLLAGPTPDYNIIHRNDLVLPDYWNILMTSLLPKECIDDTDDAPQEECKEAINETDSDTNTDTDSDANTDTDSDSDDNHNSDISCTTSDTNSDSEDTDNDTRSIPKRKQLKKRCIHFSSESSESSEAEDTDTLDD